MFFPDHRLKFFITLIYHRRRRQHESAHRRHRPIVFRCSPAGAQRAAVFTTSGLADTHQGPRCQQSQLLLFGAGRCLQSSPWLAPVSSERCSSADFLGGTVGSHHSASPRPVLVASPRVDTVPTLCIFWHFVACTGTAPTYLAESLQRTTAVEGRRHPRSADTLLLTVPPTQRSPLGDRSFRRSSGKIVESPTRFHSERLVCRHLPPSSEE